MCITSNFGENLGAWDGIYEPSLLWQLGKMGPKELEELTYTGIFNSRLNHWTIGLLD